jgi:hypothetical protein
VVAWWWLIVAAQVGALVGYFVAALMCVSSEQSRLEEARERAWQRTSN